MKRTEMKKHFTSMKAAALTMLLSASLMAAAVPASAAVTAALTAPTGLETVQRDDDELTLAWRITSCTRKDSSQTATASSWKELPASSENTVWK